MSEDGVSDCTRPVVLIGLRGCGKTTVGRKLAGLLGGRHVDTDEWIVQAAGKTIAAIFRDEGEAGFRVREHRAIDEVMESPPRVLSVGGGAILDSANVSKLEDATNVVWLTASPETLWQRISGDSSTADARPALTDRLGVAELLQLLDARRQAYEAAADIVVDTMRKTPEEVAGEILRRLASAPTH